MAQRRSLAVAILLAGCAAAAAAGFLPEDHRELNATVPLPEMEALLHSVEGQHGVAVSVEAKSAGGRPVYLVHLPSRGPATWRVLIYAQQHGDEVSGKDASLFLVRDFARGSLELPPGTEVWIMPMVNPDGAVAGTRRNAAGADLNRDHMALEQPETQALYRVVRRVVPDLAVDCHEFDKDSERAAARGWKAWPEITMDGVNNPLLDAGVIAASRRWVDEAADAEQVAGHRFTRYWVGGLPPDEEQRHSAPDTDGGLNGVGAYGGLSFIIEANQQAPLASRVDAYLVLLRRFLADTAHRDADRAAVRAARTRRLPAFIPTNVLWVNTTGAVTRLPMMNAATGQRVDVPTANLMADLAVKRSVPAPLAYAVEPREAATFAELLRRHAIPFDTLAAPRKVAAETCTLLRVEDDFDEVYSRYEGRAIVKRAVPAARELAPGTLWVPLDGPDGVRAALLLEPAAMYGLYQYPRYRAMAGPDGTLPVARVVGE